MPKIQRAINAKYSGSGALKGLKASIGIVNGDVRITSATNLSTTCIGLNVGIVGGTTLLFGEGIMPSVSSNTIAVKGSPYGSTTNIVSFGDRGYLPENEIYDKTSGKTFVNSSEYILDDGNGNLSIGDRVVGWIDYKKGHLEFTHIPNATFEIHCDSHSAHSGTVNHNASGYNAIQAIKARSVNKIANSKIEVILLG